MKRTIAFLLSMITAISLLGSTVTVYADETYSDDIYPEEVYDGGTLVLQSAEYVFYNDPDDMCFYAKNRMSDEVIKLTDYPAANINLTGDNLIFTDMSATITSSVQSSVINTEKRYLYGGNMYRIENVSALDEDVKVSRIGQKGVTYYRVTCNDDGMYALCGSEDSDDIDYERLDENGQSIGFIDPVDGEIIDAIDIDGYLYLEVAEADGRTYILCIDRDNDSGRKTTFPGMNMHLIFPNIQRIIHPNSNYDYRCWLVGSSHLRRTRNRTRL